MHVVRHTLIQLNVSSYSYNTSMRVTCNLGSNILEEVIVSHKVYRTCDKSKLYFVPMLVLEDTAM